MPDKMRNWKITGFIATLAIVLSIPIYYLKEESGRTDEYGAKRETTATFVGSKKCMDCHKKQYDNWQHSHHDHAMDVANEKTVLGDFNDAVFKLHGTTSRFYRKDGRFFVHTNGPDGKMGEFDKVLIG